VGEGEGGTGEGGGGRELRGVSNGEILLEKGLKIKKNRCPPYATGEREGNNLKTRRGRGIKLIHLHLYRARQLLKEVPSERKIGGKGARRGSETGRTLGYAKESLIHIKREGKRQRATAEILSGRSGVRKLRVKKDTTRAGDPYGEEKSP